MNPTERFWAKVDRRRSDGCWLWTGSKNRGGYGTITVNGHTRAVHRVAYELLVGPIPDGLQLDHLCRVRHCVNPAHLEPVTQRENILRGQGLAAANAAKTHCLRGHPFDGSNTYVWRGKRFCRACNREHQRKVAARAREAAS